MNITVLKETKNREGRVALTPPQARILRGAGHRVFVQKNAGVISGFPDRDYAKAGAKIFTSTGEGIKKADLVLRVKEPTFKEVGLMHPGQMIFCYLHLAAFPALTKKILQRKIIALGYETVQMSDGSLPLLKPMSEIAGKLAAQNGAHFLRSDIGGRGVLMGGTQKVPPAEVLILGGGVVGENACKIATGMGAKTRVLDRSLSRLKRLKQKQGCEIYLSTPAAIRKWILRSDLVIGAVLIPGARAPKLVSRALVKKMKKGSVIVDVAVDQGGCIETSEVTSHQNPVIVKYGVLHYGVPNIPAVVPVTGTLALTGATFPYIKSLAQNGLAGACKKHPEMKLAVNCAEGKIIHPALFSLKETITIQSDAELMKDIKRGLKELKSDKARLYTLEKLFN